MNISEFEYSMGLTLGEAENILLENGFSQNFLATNDAKVIIFAAKKVIDNILNTNERFTCCKAKQFPE